MTWEMRRLGLGWDRMVYSVKEEWRDILSARRLASGDFSDHSRAPTFVFKREINTRVLKGGRSHPELPEAQTESAL